MESCSGGNVNSELCDLLAASIAVSENERISDGHSIKPCGSPVEMLEH